MFTFFHNNRLFYCIQIQLLVFAVASRSNATELELKNLFVNPKDIAPLTITEPAENKV